MADDNDAVTQDLESDDPFPEVTRKERRALLGLSSLAIFMFLTGATAVFSHRVGDETYVLQLTFVGDGLVAQERYVVGYFGMNVSFDGVYRKPRAA